MKNHQLMVEEEGRPLPTPPFQGLFADRIEIGKECFRFMGNFIRMTFPASEVVTPQVTEQVTEQVLNLLAVADQTGRTSTELMALVGIKHRPTFLYNYLQPAVDKGLLAMTIPDKPKSSKQRYVLTALGKRMVNKD